MFAYNITETEQSMINKLYETEMPKKSDLFYKVTDNYFMKSKGNLFIF